MIANAAKIVVRLVGRQWAEKAQAAEIGFQARGFGQRANRLTTRANTLLTQLAGS